MPFEPQVPPVLTGDVTSVIVKDPNGLVPAITVVRMKDPWTVNVKWYVQGDLASDLNPATVWRVGIRLESIGGGLETEVLYRDIPLMPFSFYQYDEDFDIPAANSFNNFAPGVYKLIVVITSNIGGVPQTMAGYKEGPMLQFYDFP